MGSGAVRILGWLITACLSVAILPSWTAISRKIYGEFGISDQLTGPINPLKLAVPVLFLFLYSQRAQLRDLIPRRVALFLLVGYSIGTLSVVYGASTCAWSPTLFREWLMHGLAALWAVSFFLVSNHQRKWIVGLWLTWLAVFSMIDVAAPSWLDWLFQNVFDPRTRDYDPLEVGDVLTGVFGRQTLAKFLAWIPWLTILLLPHTRQSPQKHFGFVVGMAAVLVPAGLILATSQRGPFAAVITAALVTIWLYARREGLHRQTLVIMLTAFAISVGVLTVLFVPQPILESRVRSMVGLPPVGFLGMQAEQNKSFRWNMISLSLEIIRENPMGKACIDDNWYFWNRGTMVAHSHHVFLQEFRSRGWIWGLFHLVMWLLCGWSLYRALPLAWENIFWFGGFLSILLSGQFDYPWMALSQSIILWVFLWKGFMSYGKT